jgi:DNA polymerase-3 subunit gamma/tau
VGLFIFYVSLYNYPMAESKSQVYEVTASRRRPKTFDELAGQEFVVSTLKNSLQNGQIAHAYLFSGPRGCGKTSAARILARSLNCLKNNQAERPCGDCDNCRSISRGASMDVLEIDGASNNSVNDVRQIKDEVLFPPQTGRYKVYIIDEVHMLSGSAFNALLKTIEEPPPYIVFIFATTELHKVPATIKSRCQQFNFRLIPIETIQKMLRKICAETSIEAEDDALFWIARESTGSLRDAFTLFDQVVSFSSGNIRSDIIREKLGLTGLDKLNALAEACAANDSSGAFMLADEIISAGVAVEQFVIDLAGYYRSLLLLKNEVTRESLLGYKPSLFSVKVLETFDSVRLEQALDILLECYRNMRYSVSPRFELETAVSRLTWLNRWISPLELRDAMENTRSALHLQRSHSGHGSVSNTVEIHRPTGTAAKDSQSGKVLPVTPIQHGEGLSLSDDLRRMIAAKETGENNAGEDSDQNNDEDVPVWSSIINKNPDMPPQVERVLSLIPGVMID